MTIDEAIAQEKEVAKEKYTEAMLCHANPNDEKLDECIECAREHEQLAEWLEELKAYRTLDKTNFSDGYNKAIDDFAEELRQRRTRPYMQVNCDDIELKLMKEKLKAGGENDT